MSGMLAAERDIPYMITSKYLEQQYSFWYMLGTDIKYINLLTV